MNDIPVNRHFIALDTETIRGRAFLLSTAEAVYPIDSWESFVDRITDMGSSFVFYNLDYDITGLLAYLPDAILKLLYYRGRVQLGGWQLRYIPRKYFGLRPAGHRTGVDIYDLYPFFQMSLDRAVKKFIAPTIGKIVLPENWWNDFDYEKYLAHRELFDRYAIQDAALLQELADRFFLAVDAAGLTCRHFYSPASLAKRFLSIQIGRRKLDLSEYMPTLEKAYFGGRIECHRRGWFPAVNVYDIRSAYPAAMRDLPDFRDPTLWRSKRPEAKYFIASVRVKSDAPILPYRHRSKIMYPIWTGQRATVTNFEFDQLTRNGADVTIDGVLNIDVPDNQILRRHIDTLYERRAVGGMEKQVWKLVLNSLYGVMAQLIRRWRPVSESVVAEYVRRRIQRDALSLFVARQAQKCVNAAHWYDRKCRCKVCDQTRRIVRHIGRVGTFELGGDDEIGFYRRYPTRSIHGNMLFAIYTTALVRCRIADVIMADPQSFIGSATDSIMTTGTIKTGTGIGSWNREYTGWLCLVGSGVYQTANAVKFRGFETDVDLLTLLRSADGLSIPIRQTRRESIAQFARADRGFNAHNLNILLDTDKYLRVDFDHKRVWFDKLNAGRQLTERSFESQPLTLGIDL